MTDPAPPPTRELAALVLADPWIVLRAEDTLEAAAAFERRLGGDAVSAAIDAASRGVQVALASRVGDDPFAAWLCAAWEDAGLHLDVVTRGPGRTPLALEGPGATRPVRYREATAISAWRPEDLRDAPFELAAWVVAVGETQAHGPATRETMRHAFAEARRRGARTLFAPGLRMGLWPGDDRAATAAAIEAFEGLRGLTDVLVLSAPYETGKLLGHPAAEAAAREALRHGVDTVVIREGSRRAVVADRHGPKRVHAPRPAPRPSTTEAPLGADTAAESLDATERRARFLGMLIAGLGRGRTAAAAAEVALGV